jgi:hypothetical protein
MACGCARRMRKILKAAGFILEADGIWRKEGRPEYSDMAVEDDHDKIILEVVENEARDWVKHVKQKAAHAWAFLIEE